MRAFPIALHPKTFQMTVGRLLAWPPNSHERSRSADFGGKHLTHFTARPELPGIAGAATLGLRASTVTYSG